MSKIGLIDIIDLFTLFIDYVKDYPYLPPYFSMGLSRRQKDHFIWGISLLNSTYSYMNFFSEAEEDTNEEKLYIRDKELNIPEFIEEIYNINLKRKHPDYDPQSWNKKETYDAMKEKYPKAFTYIERKRIVAEKTRKQLGINITNQIDKWGNTYLEITYNTKELDVKDRVVKIFEGIETLRKIYEAVSYTHLTLPTTERV